MNTRASLILSMCKEIEEKRQYNPYFKKNEIVKTTPDTQINKINQDNLKESCINLTATIGYGKNMFDNDGADQDILTEDILTKSNVILNKENQLDIDEYNIQMGNKDEQVQIINRANSFLHQDLILGFNEEIENTIANTCTTMKKNKSEDNENDEASIVSGTTSGNSINSFDLDFSSDDDIVDPDYKLETESDDTSGDDVDGKPTTLTNNELLEDHDSVIEYVPQITCDLPKATTNERNQESIYNEETDRLVVIPMEVERNKENEGEVERALKKNYKDRKDLCIFCEKDVSHFSRHLVTWHSSEIEVEKIMSLKVNSKERKTALTLIRKQGNFIRNRTSTMLRPVKRVQESSNAAADNFLPCKYCLGFYKKASLYRHTKRCVNNPDKDKKGKRQSAQSDGQTTLLISSMFKHDQLLKDKLFPRMRADEIALSAKRDLIICNYAYSYMKGRRSKGNLDVVRQNTRRLAKLLIFAQKKHGSEIREFLNILRPQHFKTIVEAVNVMAKYNVDTDRFESPTLAMNFGTLIKKCCDVAYIHLLQKNSDTSMQRKELKILKTLIESQWGDEVSAQAASNLNENRWNKEDLIPLSADLKILGDYLATNSNKYFIQLQQNDDNFDDYNNLKELLYVQILLLNRRRPAEVAQIKVHTYTSIDLQSSEENEFVKHLTETEKILLKTYNRIVIRGKRGRGVPVLLSPSMKEQFDMLIDVRQKFVHNNDYIFHTLGNGFLDGTKILCKHARKCGAKQPERITSTRLRKHLATISQLLHFSENDLEQLSRFMGHTLKTHLGFYRMSDNLYQTAKISKLLLLMANGKANEFIGKNLDEIDIDLNPIYDERDIFEEIDPGPSSSNIEIDADSSVSFNKYIDSQKEITIPSKTKLSKQVPGQRQKWTEAQKNILLKQFAEHIKSKRAPKKHEIEQLQTNYPEHFRHRNWKGIKAYIFNVYRGNLRNT